MPKEIIQMHDEVERLDQIMKAKILINKAEHLPKGDPKRLKLIAAAQALLGPANKPSGKPPFTRR
jgi:hypothetical protein